MSLQQIAAVIIARDAAATIGGTLESLRRFPEVVVYDNGSVDATVEIASSYPNVRVFTGEFLGFGPTKNHAADLAEHDWIFSIDSDESVSPELLRALDSAALDPASAYVVNRHNYFMGKRVRHSGWGGDWLVRLYHRSRLRFEDAMVHEKVAVPGDTPQVRLDGALHHEAVREIGQFLVKINRYSEIRSQTARRAYHPAYIVIKSLWAFFRTYVLRLGCLDGWRGLVISVSNANGVFFKYMKPYVDKTTRDGG